MRLLYHDLVGKHIVTTDGRDVGGIADLRAEPRDGKLRVVSLLVGPRALVERIGSGVPAAEIPWSLVHRIGELVELRVTSAELVELLAESVEARRG